MYGFGTSGVASRAGFKIVIGVDPALALVIESASVRLLYVLIRPVVFLPTVENRVL